MSSFANAYQQRNEWAARRAHLVPSVQALSEYVQSAGYSPRQEGRHLSELRTATPVRSLQLLWLAATRMGVDPEEALGDCLVLDQGPMVGLYEEEDITFESLDDGAFTPVLVLASDDARCLGGMDDGFEDVTFESLFHAPDPAYLDALDPLCLDDLVAL